MKIFKPIVLACLLGLSIYVAFLMPVPEKNSGMNPGASTLIEGVPWKEVFIVLQEN